MKNLIKTILFISAFSPTLLALAYVEYNQNGLDIKVYQLTIISILGTLSAFLITTMSEKFIERTPLTIKKIESSDIALLAFMSSYFLPILLKSFDMNYSLIIVITTVAFIFFWNIMTLPAHPLLYLFKYRFYKVESENGRVYTLLSKKAIKDPKKIKFVKSLTDSMLMEAI